MKQFYRILPFCLAAAVLLGGCGPKETSSQTSSPQSSSPSSSVSSSDTPVLPNYEIAVKQDGLPAPVISDSSGSAKADALVQVVIDNLEGQTSSYLLYPLKDGFAVRNDHRYRAYLELDTQGKLKDFCYFETDEKQTGHPPRLLADEASVMLNRDNGKINFYDESFDLIKSNQIKGLDSGCASALDGSGSRAAYVLHEQDGMRKGRTLTLCNTDDLEILASYSLDEMGDYEGYIINTVSFVNDSILCLKLYGDGGLGVKTILFDMEPEQILYEVSGPANAIALDQNRVLLTNQFNASDGGQREDHAVILSIGNGKIAETPLDEEYQTVALSLNGEYLALAKCDDDQSSVELASMRVSDGQILWEVEMELKDDTPVTFASTSPVISDDGKTIYYPTQQGIIYRAYVD